MLDNPRIEFVSEKKLIGNKLEMSFVADKTFQLWSGFMSRHKEIKNRKGTHKFSLQNYSENFQLDPTISFVKWATVEVQDFETIPEGMESYTTREGFFAVFNYHGSSKNALPIFEYIFKTWLPNSIYELDKCWGKIIIRMEMPMKKFISQ